MIRLVDGPARGQAVGAARAPIVMRIGDSGKPRGGLWRALDALNFRPIQGEVVVVYIQVGHAPIRRRTMRDRAYSIDARKVFEKVYAYTEVEADYYWYVDQPDPAFVAEPLVFGAWIQTNAKAIMDRRRRMGRALTGLQTNPRDPTNPVRLVYCREHRKCGWLGGTGDLVGKTVCPRCGGGLKRAPND